MDTRSKPAVDDHIQIHHSPATETSFEKSVRLLQELGLKIDLMNADTERRVCALEELYDRQSAKIPK